MVICIVGIVLSGMAYNNTDCEGFIVLIILCILVFIVVGMVMMMVNGAEEMGSLKKSIHEDARMFNALDREADEDYYFEVKLRLKNNITKFNRKLEYRQTKNFYKIIFKNYSGWKMIIDAKEL